MVAMKEVVWTGFSPDVGHLILYYLLLVLDSPNSDLIDLFAQAAHQFLEAASSLEVVEQQLL